MAGGKTAKGVIGCSCVKVTQCYVFALASVCGSSVQFSETPGVMHLPSVSMLAEVLFYKPDNYKDGYYNYYGCINLFIVFGQPVW